jgi:hypothetical protein
MKFRPPVIEFSTTAQESAPLPQFVYIQREKAARVSHRLEYTQPFLSAVETFSKEQISGREKGETTFNCCLVTVMWLICAAEEDQQQYREYHDYAVEAKRYDVEWPLPDPKVRLPRDEIDFKQDGAKREHHTNDHHDEVFRAIRRLSGPDFAQIVQKPKKWCKH